MIKIHYELKEMSSEELLALIHRFNQPKSLIEFIFLHGDTIKDKYTIKGMSVDYVRIFACSVSVAATELCRRAKEGRTK